MSDLEKFEAGSTVDTDALLKAGVISKTLDGVKVLGNGALARKLHVKAAKCTKTADEAIKAAGGSVEVIG